MSHIVNERLMEEARQASEDLTGTTFGKTLDAAIANDDLETIFYLLKEYRKLQFEENYRPSEEDY